MKLIYTGLLALLWALAVIGICWYLNPWFNFWEDAFSDFGVKGACPWLYNWGLITSSAFFLVYSLSIYRISSTKGEAFASGLLLTASIFLALIGFFPGGTRPHTFVSTWFFLQSFMGFFALGVSIYRKGDRKGLWAAVSSALAPIVGIGVELTVGWPSAAVAEAAGILIIGISLLSSTLHYSVGDQ